MERKKGKKLVLPLFVVVGWRASENYLARISGLSALGSGCDQDAQDYRGN
jgi:hypothetical protein